MMRSQGRRLIQLRDASCAPVGFAAIDAAIAIAALVVGYYLGFGGGGMLLGLVVPIAGFAAAVEKRKKAEAEDVYDEADEEIAKL